MLSKYSNYKETVATVKKVNDNSSQLTGNESDIVEKLYNLIIEDKSYKVVADIFNNNVDLKRLIHKIDKQIAQLYSQISDIDNKLARVKKDEDLINKEKYLEKISKLEILKKQIVEFMNSNNHNVDDKYKNLVSLSLFSLSSGFFELDEYFGKKFGNLSSDNNLGFYLNEDTINIVYSLLNDRMFIEQLQLGVDLVNEGREVARLNDVCDEALKFKSYIYNNMNSIFAYNIFRNKLGTIKSKLKEEKYSDLELRLKIVEEDLERFDDFELAKIFRRKKWDELINEQDELIILINERDQLGKEIAFLESEVKKLSLEFSKVGLRFDSYNGRKSNHKLSLEYNLGKFSSKEEISDYFYEIIQKKHKCLSALEGNKSVRETFLNDTDSRVLELLQSDFITAENIVKLSRRKENGGISPMIALLVLKTIAILRNSNINDMGITTEQYNRVRDYYIKEIDENYSKFNKAYNQIIYFGDSDIIKKKK